MSAVTIEDCVKMGYCGTPVCVCVSLNASLTLEYVTTLTHTLYSAHLQWLHVLNCTCETFNC